MGFFNLSVRTANLMKGVNVVVARIDSLVGALSNTKNVGHSMP